MSVGHVSRAFESAGVPSVIIMSNVFRGRVVVQKPSRTVFTKHIMGRPMSAPFDVERQTNVLRAALNMLETATEGETGVVLPDAYRVVGA